VPVDVSVKRATPDQCDDLPIEGGHAAAPVAAVPLGVYSSRGAITMAQREAEVAKDRPRCGAA
jgi:hypothetical protein